MGIGTTSAVFQGEGKVEEPREELTIDVIAGRIGAIQSLITRIGMLSIPEALLEKLLAYGMLSRCETMLVKIRTMLVSQGFNLVYSVLTNGHKKIIKLIGDNFIVSAECSRRSRVFRNAMANSFPNVIGVSRITLDLIGDKFSLCKSNFPFYLSPEVFIS